MQLNIVWSRSSNFKLKCSLEGGELCEAKSQTCSPLLLFNSILSRVQGIMHSDMPTSTRHVYIPNFPLKTETKDSI